MQNNQLNRLLKLINRTGDRLVVLDKDTDLAVVMMEINEYEKLLDGNSRLENMSEEDILDRINREVAIWREKNLANSIDLESEDNFAPSSINEAESVNLEEKDNNEEVQEKTDLSLRKTEITKEEPVVNPVIDEEEELKDVPDDGEEEKFYLEPV